MSEMLPLFPLGTVLFPGLVLPLQVFEERYRVLVEELLALPEDAPRQFGVVAIRQGREVGAEGVRALYDVGCLARVQRVEPRDDGRFELVTAGTRRFRLHGLDRERPYLRGTVEWLDDPNGAEEDAAEEDAAEPKAAEAAVLADSARRAFRAYIDGMREVGGTRISVSELPEDPLLLSYLVAATLLVDLDVRQDLLATPDAVARLRTELSLITRELTMLRTFAAAPALEFTRAPRSPN